MLRRASVLLILLFGLVPSLAATVLLPADFNDIVSGSQIIVHGRVIDVRAEWSADRSQIESFVTVTPSSFYRGTVTDAVTFKVPGGEVGRYKQVTVGAPAFAVGDEAVFFLRANGPSVPGVFGLNQGVFRVRVDQRTGRRMVVLPIVQARGAAPERVSRGARTRQPLALDVFGAQLRATMQQGGAR